MQTNSTQGLELNEYIDKGERIKLVEIKKKAK